MNPDIKTQWLSALRSGKYPQTRGALHRIVEGGEGEPVGFCCLGVLCDLAVKAGVAEEVVRDGRYLVGYRTDVSYGQDSLELHVLPRDVQEWAGLKSHQGIRTPEGPLPMLNDNGKTFAEIADIIEEHA